MNPASPFKLPLTPWDGIPWLFPSFEATSLPPDVVYLHTELILATHMVDHLRTFLDCDLQIPFPEVLLEDARLSLAESNPLLDVIHPSSGFSRANSDYIAEALLGYFMEKISIIYDALSFLPNPEPEWVWFRAATWAFTLLSYRLLYPTVKLAMSGSLDHSDRLPFVPDTSPPSPQTQPGYATLDAPTPFDSPLSLSPPSPPVPSTESPSSSTADPTPARFPSSPTPSDPSPVDPLDSVPPGSGPTPSHGTSDAASQMGKTIVNLSKSFRLSAQQTELLSKGLTFIPTAKVEKEGVWRTLELETYRYHRRLRLAWAFKATREDDSWRDDPKQRFVPPSLWQPPFSSLPPPVQQLFLRDRLSFSTLRSHSYEPPEPNVTRKDMASLKDLGTNTRLVIKPADKGSAIVIQDREDYVWEARRQLNMAEYYRILETPLGPSTAPRIEAILDRLVLGGFIKPVNRDVLRGVLPHETRTIYFLPKIHKKPESWSVPGLIPPGRPIVSDCGSETYVISEYLDMYMNPLSHLHPSYVKDTYDFLTKVRAAEIKPSDFLFSMDVDSLYTNIETEPGVEAVRRSFLKYPDPARPDSLLLELLHLSLTTNDFLFDGTTYLQVKGVAMGKKFAPALADIYMAEWEETALSRCRLKPSYYLRYLDDIWGVWPHSKEEFLEFFNTLNGHHRSIKLKFELDPNSMNFLDTTIFKGPDFPHSSRLDSKVYFKTTDTHALLHKTSFHPRHTFEGVVKSQLIRFKRICSREEDFNEATRILFGVLRKRGYTRSFLRQIKRDYLRKTKPREGKLLPLVAFYGPRAYHLNRRFKRNFQELLGGSEEFSSWVPLASYKKNPCLKDLLVRSKLPPLEPPPSARPTNRTYFRRPVFHSGGDSRPCPRALTTSLDTTNCVYLIRCVHCGKGYVGETGLALRQRIAVHHNTIRTPHRGESSMVRHFRALGLDFLKVTVLEHRPSWTPSQRRRAEFKWINFLNTAEPRGFNRRVIRY